MAGMESQITIDDEEREHVLQEILEGKTIREIAV